MDVHHHPELPHGKKKHFKEYFLEFVMIFLAVTMGFISENIREHFLDNSKEHEYITGMIKNLQDDTAQLKLVISQNRRQLKGIDSIWKVPKTKLTSLAVQDSLFLLTSKYIFYANNFKNNQVTISQLKNAGGYSLIRNTKVLDSIAEFESRVRDLDDEFSYNFASLTKTREYANALFDFSMARSVWLHPTATPILITNEKDKIYQYYNQCWLTTLGFNGYDQMLNKHYKYSCRLIAYLKKEYDVE
jgi:hypothetical protein